MEHNVTAKNNVNIEVNAPCPKCDNGHLIPFLRAIYKGGEYAQKEFDHYEIFYRCSNCNHLFEEDSFF